MKKKASIISCKENTNKIVQAIKNTKYNLVNIFEENVDFDKLKGLDYVFADDNIDNSILNNLELFCMQNNISFNIYASSINLRKTQIRAVDDLCFLYLNPYQLTKFNKAIKRIFDIIFSVSFIIISFPLFVFVFFLIKIFDTGPVLYRQKRLTIAQKEFVIYKFRTMKENAEKETGAVLARDDDPRLTCLGKFLRKTRLDEIPQIFNVLSGDMSVVGPRPERLYFVNKFNEQNPYYKFRFNVKAGITGYAQLYAKYESAFKDKLDYDLYYISNYSFYRDLVIILKTAINIFKPLKPRYIANNILIKDKIWENQIEKN